MSKKLEFPKGFLWGAATSAHQVEGGNHNDWSEWEKKNAEKLAHDAKNKWEPWQQKKFPEMFDATNYISGRAADHYNRYEEDFDIAKSMGHNAHRLSLEWSRIEPEEGKFDEEAIEHYRKVIRALRARGMEPFVTLWHWPLPVWLAQKNGLEYKKYVDCFLRYIDKTTETLKDDVKFWITINEPQVYASQAYLNGQWIPQKKNIFAYFSIIQKLIKAHNSSYNIIKKHNSSAQIGIAKNNIYFEASGINTLLKKPIDWWWNYYFLNKISEHQDFIGLNNYFHNRVHYGFNKNKNKKHSDMGWELYPESVYHVLVGIKKYNVPVYVTENGLADRDDSNREWFIKNSVKQIHHALNDGVDVKGYLYWSLLDNFEWDKGFWPRFGLVEVDFKTQERKIRKSAHEYAKICKSDSLEVED